MRDVGNVVVPVQLRSRIGELQHTHLLRRRRKRPSQWKVKQEKNRTSQTKTEAASLAIDNNDRFWDLDKVNSSAKRAADHKLGPLRFLVKGKWFDKWKTKSSKDRSDATHKDVKFRPIASYRFHVYRRLLSVANKAANWVLESCVPDYNHRKVSDFITATDKLNDACLDGRFGFHSADISQFFVNIDTQVACEFIDFLVRKLMASGHRYYRIRRDDHPIRWHSTQRSVRDAPLSDAPKESFTNMKPSSKKCDWIALSEIARVLKHDVDHSCHRALGSVWRQIAGAPMGSPVSDALSNSCASACGSMQNAGDPEVQGKRIFTGRFKDDKHAFSLVPRVRFSLSSLESPAPSAAPRCVDTDFCSSHCPLEDTTGERVFCKVQVRARGNQIYVAPTAAKSIVHATSAISSSARRAIPSGVFARLSQHHNKIARPFAREALLGLLISSLPRVTVRCRCSVRCSSTFLTIVKSFNTAKILVLFFRDFVTLAHRDSVTLYSQLLQ